MKKTLLKPTTPFIKFPPVLQTILIGEHAVELYLPDPAFIAAAYKEKIHTASTLYWAKVWPGAIGLCIFLQNHTGYIKNKHVLELGAGPGLPGIFCANYAQHVCISDIAEEAVAFANLSANHLHLTNVKCKIIDWNDAEKLPTSDVVLLSDVNYDITVFDGLLASINHLFQRGCTIILSTPQRLMAKKFIDSLLLFCKEQDEVTVCIENTNTAISIFVLQK